MIEGAEVGRGLTFAEASAMKLYSARAAMEVALEAVVSRIRAMLAAEAAR